MNKSTIRLSLLILVLLASLIVLVVFNLEKVAAYITGVESQPILPSTQSVEQNQVEPFPPTWTPTATLAETPQPNNPQPGTAATPTDSTLGVFTFPDGVNPLTGLTVTDPSILERRPVMIKVSNYPRYGRPHAGLSYADVVFDYYIGYGYNRFLAIFYGNNSPSVGPIRSGRLVDAQLANLYQGLLVYGNADPQVDKVLVDNLGVRAMPEKDIPCPPVCGDDTHSVAGVFADSAGVTDYASQAGIPNRKPDLRGMLFDPAVPTGDGYGTFVAIQFGVENRGEWRYDPNTGQYLRWIEQERDGDAWNMIPLVDRVNNQQLAFSNVVILMAHYTTYAPTLHDISVLDNRAGQTAVFFRDGVMTIGSWKTSDHNRPIQFFDSNGFAYALKPGNTWIVIGSPESTLAEIQSGAWEYKFDIPWPTPTFTPDVTNTPSP
jgi:hypothetical protein